MEMKHPPRALVVGATSSLAQSMCRILAAAGCELVLAGRDTAELDMLAADIRIRFGHACETMKLDFLDSGFSAAKAIEDAGNITHLFLVTGDMGKRDITHLGDIAYVMHVNYTIPAQLAAAAALHMNHKHGTIVVVSSVAGARGRSKIAAYGSAKAALTTFTSALRQTYAKRDVHVMTVIPGYIDTPMTWGMNSPLIARREAVARRILRAMKKKKDVVYVPGFWRWIMLIINLIPEKIFKRLSF